MTVRGVAVRTKSEPMTVGGIGRTVVRWKWIWIPMLIVGVLAGAGLYVKTPATYTAASSYVFISPVKSATGVAGNPFITGSNGLGQTADLVSLQLTDAENTKKFAAGHPKLEYTMALDPSVSATLLVITVDDDSPTSALQTLDELGDAVQQQLSTLQESAGAPKTQWITATRLTRDQKPTVSIMKGIRNGALGFGGMFLLAIVGVVLAEIIRTRRSGASRSSQVPPIDLEGSAGVAAPRRVHMVRDEHGRDFVDASAAARPGRGRGRA